MPDSQGMYVVAEKVSGLPPFITSSDDYRVIEPPSRRILWWPNGKLASAQKMVRVLELIDAASAPLTRIVGLVTLHYWWINIRTGEDEQQARKWAAWLFNDLGNPSRSGTLGQLIENNNVDHQRMKNDSPDLRRATAHDPAGAPIAWDVYLQHEVFGQGLRQASSDTSATAINAEVPEQPGSVLLVAGAKTKPIRVKTRVRAKTP